MKSPIQVSDLLASWRPLKRFCEWLRERPLLVVPLFLGLYGYGSIDVSDFRVLSAAPLELHVLPQRQFLQSSPLIFFLGYPFTRTIGATWSFAIVMLGGLAFFSVALARFAAARYRPVRGQHDAMLMVFATPLLIVLSQYLGKSDPYMVAFLLLLLAATHPVSQVLLAGLVVLSHLEIGLLVLGSAMFLRLVRVRSAILGGLAGALLILGYHYYLLPSPPQSRAGIAVELLSEAVGAVFNTPVHHLVLTFGPFWLCVLMARRMDWRWFVVLGATTLVAITTLDFTRTFTLVGLPLIIAIVDTFIPRSESVGTDYLPPRWVQALPLCAFFQAHVLSNYIYDSRLPQLIGRLIEYARR
jgi:hypothetical protein